MTKRALRLPRPSALAATAGLAVALSLAAPQVCDPFCFRVTIAPLPGYENVVDAVTQASTVIGAIYVDVDRPADAADSIRDVVINYGDGTSKRWLNGTFPVDSGNVRALHWYVRVDTVSGMCTTTVTTTTYGGKSRDTSIVIRVLAANQVAGVRQAPAGRAGIVGPFRPTRHMVVSAGRGASPGLVVQEPRADRGVTRRFDLGGRTDATRQ